MLKKEEQLKKDSLKLEQVLPVEVGLLQSLLSSKTLIAVFVILSVLLGSFFTFLVYMAR